MKTNIDLIQEIIDYIESHLDDKLNLDSICLYCGYSKYHLSRLFSSVTGFSVHNYIQRRKLTESARLLVFTDMDIMQIALSAGYETQQSFTTAFKSLFKCSPNAFRKKRDFYPFQLEFKVDGINKLRGDKIMDIKVIEKEKLRLIGFKKNTKMGFFVIGKCWKNIHSKKHLISNRINEDFLIGLNDYSTWNDSAEKQPAFDYYAASEVSMIDKIPKGMSSIELAETKYLVFSFKACSQDSLQPVSDYIYKEWLPQSTYQLNEAAKYDFARYSEYTDESGNNLIEYWVPIL